MIFKIVDRYTLEPVQPGQQCPGRSYYPSHVYVGPANSNGSSVYVRRTGETWATEVPALDAGFVAQTRYLP